MNNIADMPPKCHNCPYWEICEYPYVCPTQDEKKELKVGGQLERKTGMKDTEGERYANTND